MMRYVIHIHKDVVKSLEWARAGWRSGSEANGMPLIRIRWSAQNAWKQGLSAVIRWSCGAFLVPTGRVVDTYRASLGPRIPFGLSAQTSNPCTDWTDMAYRQAGDSLRAWRLAGGRGFDGRPAQPGDGGMRLSGWTSAPPAEVCRQGAQQPRHRTFCAGCGVGRTRKRRWSRWAT